MGNLKMLSALFAVFALSIPVLADGERRRLDPNNVAPSSEATSEGTGASEGIIASRFIVEFSEAGSSKFRKRDGSPVDALPALPVLQDTEQFYEDVKKLDHNLIPHQNFTSELFHGASFEIVDKTNETLVGLEALPEVVRVWPVELITVPKPPPGQEDGEGGEGGEQEVSLNKRQIAASPFVETYYPHLMTRVEDVHAQGINGSGVVVAIVDSGVFYNHPALGPGFGPGFKVEGGWDLVGPDYLPGDTVLNPGPDPLDCYGHGTHVAGIVGSTEPRRIGAAPGARIRAYKVFGCFEGTTSDIVLAAFLMAFEDGADIISGSLGNDNGFAESPIAQVITRIAEQGVLVVTAAGNSGGDGPFLSSNTANGKGALAVGSLNVRRQHGFDLLATASNGENRVMKYFPEKQVPWDLPLNVKANKGNLTRDFDLCDAGTRPWLPPRGDAPRNYKIPDEDIWILKRATGFPCLTSWSYVDAETAYLAKSILFWNVPERPNLVPVRFPSEGSVERFATVNYEDGQWIEDQLEAGFSVLFNFTADNLLDASGAFVNDFSSWGLTLDGSLVPHISAHGDSVWSTSVARGAAIWTARTGTSMATPYISSVAALFFQSVGGRASLASGGKNPAEVARTRIINSGRTVGHSNFTVTPAASVAQQGAGIVNAMKVVSYVTSADPPIIHLNDTDHFTSSHTITITNSGDTPITYNISHVAGPTALSRPFADAYIEFETPLKIDQGLASVAFSTQELVVPANGQASFTATFTEPNDINPMILPIYGGDIYVVGDNDESVKIPYAGVTGSMKEAQVWETQNGVPIFLISRENTTQLEEGHVFPAGQLPLPYFDYLWSSREYSFDVVNASWQPSDWVYPPVPGQNNFVGSSTFFDLDYGVWRSYPILLQGRVSYAFLNPLGPTYAHGSPVEAGEYRILARAVKTYGDFNKIEDWHKRLSNSFFVSAGPPANSTRRALGAY
ncbi:peptidase [Diaporthe helianthi]|uniref:Peptidase n=1 Tax=Diaporthe helianthi TaxID=158607 RepID=A0A2P5HIH3_DIAHE|nr:peptidase [Diaporthe helianthi]